MRKIRASLVSAFYCRVRKQGWSYVTLPIDLNFAPMEALLVDELPHGGERQFEPKWDGFRCQVFRDGDYIAMRSKSGQPLDRYFPEIVAAIGKLMPHSFVLDCARLCSTVLDGLIAKRLGMPYQSGNRKGMIKVKKLRTADCVVGGFRYWWWKFSTIISPIAFATAPSFFAGAPKKRPGSAHTIKWRGRRKGQRSFWIRSHNPGCTRQHPY